MALHAKQMQRGVANTAAVGGNTLNRQLYIDALSKVDSLAAFAAYIPAEDKLQKEKVLTTNVISSLHQQVQLALLAFKAGVSVSADLFERGFDTHAKHDTDHPLLLGNATDAIDYLWTYAEELGLANRLVLVIGTDFGRTPYFNASNGKDHWPIGSTVVMEKNAAFGNRVAGLTDEGHNALKLDTTTLKEDKVNGVLIRPAHVHKALRQYLGLENADITRNFAFSTTESFKFFG